MGAEQIGYLIKGPTRILKRRIPRAVRVPVPGKSRPYKRRSGWPSPEEAKYNNRHPIVRHNVSARR